MAGIPALVAKITAALALSKVRFGGTGGIGAMLSDTAELVKERGVMDVRDLSTLALMTGADGGYALIPGVGFYRYNATASASAAAQDVPASGGGRWQFLAPMGAGVFAQAIGDSVETSFTLTHNLNTLFPTVLQMEPSAPGAGAPYTYTTDGDVTVVDANTVTVTYPTAPGTFQYTIVVKAV